MTDENFVIKWNDGDKSWWSGNASRVYWRRAYHMEKEELYQMSQDLLSVNQITGQITPCSLLMATKAI